MVGVVVVAGYLWAQTPDTPSKKANKPTASLKAGKDSFFTDADYKAHFDRVKAAPQDSFRPIVARVGSGAGPNGIPPELAGGEGNWVYSGTAEVDGVVEALIENQTTGEGAFVKRGEYWKAARVDEITSTTLVLKAGDGTLRTIQLQGTGPTVVKGAAPLRVNPPLSGNIGPLTVRPDNSTRINTQASAPGGQDEN